MGLDIEFASIVRLVEVAEEYRAVFIDPAALDYLRHMWPEAALARRIELDRLIAEARAALAKKNTDV